MTPEEAAQRMREMQSRLEDLSPVLELAARDLDSLIDDSFHQSRSPGGDPWEPLSPRTIARRRNQSSKPLVDTGTLRGSVNAQHSPRSIRFGTNLPYAATHQFGHRHVPARPYLPVEPGGEWMDRGEAAEWRNELTAMIRRYVLVGEM